MKTMTLILIAGMALASCTTEPLPYEPDSRIETDFKTVTVETWQDNFPKTDSVRICTIKPVSYGAGIEAWNITLDDGPGSTEYTNGLKFTYVADSFDVAMTTAIDTIYGYGYVSQDTVWLKYHYQDLNDTSKYGYVEFHTLYPI